MCVCVDARYYATSNDSFPSEFCNNKKIGYKDGKSYSPTYIYIYTHINIYICVCVCLVFWSLKARARAQDDK